MYVSRELSKKVFCESGIIACNPVGNIGGFPFLSKVSKLLFLPHDNIAGRQRSGKVSTILSTASA